ncbi:MAG TPA: MarR family winged helix-turn-helix transcriptional regulator [Solirubrobacteraceae bacterium]|nr:MarR family winged helix-turn-helix transcriptional regulator [Solirubrobacteraceae bacterium]
MKNAGTDVSDDAPWVAASLIDPPFQTVGFNVSSVGYAVGRRFHQVLAPLALEPREFSLLRAVSAAEGQSQQAIGERLLIPPSRMVAFVDALEHRGLLERRNNPHDRRTRALHLTDDGRELLAQAFVLASQFERDICAQLSAAERAQLLELLARVSAQLGLPADAHAAHAALVEQEPAAQTGERGCGG